MGQLARKKRVANEHKHKQQLKTMAESVRRSAFLAMYHDELCTELGLGNATPQQVIEKVKELVRHEISRLIMRP